MTLTANICRDEAPPWENSAARDNEGICAKHLPWPGWVPLMRPVGGNLSTEPRLLQVRNHSNFTIWIVREVSTDMACRIDVFQRRRRVSRLLSLFAYPPRISGRNRGH